MMTKETFDQGMRMLVGAFPITVGKDMRAAFYDSLNSLPDEMFKVGVVKCCREWQPMKRNFPTPAEIGEFCVPGERFVVVQQGSRNFTKVVPWTDRLKMLENVHKKRLEVKKPVEPELSWEERKANVQKLRELVEQIMHRKSRKLDDNKKTNGDSVPFMTPEQIAERKRMLNEQADRLLKEER